MYVVLSFFADSYVLVNGCCSLLCFDQLFAKAPRSLLGLHLIISPLVQI